MRDSQEVHELEEQITQDKQRYREIDRLEDELMENIPQRGFSAVPTELRYRGEKETLTTSIREEEELVAGVRDHPDWPHNRQILEQDTNLNRSEIAVAAYYIWLDRKDKTDNSSRSQTAVSDWAQAARDLLVRD
jgi:hypothetical protein